MTDLSQSSGSFDPITPSAHYADGGSPLTGRVEVMRILSKSLPQNEIGLPPYIYRTDLIPADLYDETSISAAERVDLLNAASMSLDYLEGYPCLAGGDPFWSQLPFEPIAAFQHFVKYLDIVQVEDDTGRLVAPVRTMDATHRVTGVDPKELQKLSYQYYWPQRAKAYDLFMIANFQKQRQTRALLVEDSHYIKSRKWLAAAEQRLEEIFSDEDELMDMKPNEVFKMMLELMKLQRISVGLSNNGPSNGSGEGTATGTSLQNMIREIAAKAGERANDQEDENFSVENILEDPDAMKQLQDLITKANVSSR